MGERDERGPKGRGASGNPQNRFERLGYEPDPDAEEGERSSPRTMLFRDSTRSIVASNNSPDVGFDVSVNPYRGCEHGCSYCLSGETPILMGNGTVRRLVDLRPGDEIHGTKRVGRSRQYVRTTVLAHWRTVKPAYRVTLADGTELVTSGDHRFLTERGWKYVMDGPTCRPHLTTNDKLVGVGAFAVSARDESAITRKRDFEGRAVTSRAQLRVRSIEPLGVDVPLYDITTGTGDFIANGVVSHNCYARPTHEYLGFSAGLDFESRIMVKEDAPELLRKELSSPRWKPQPISMSGVTDPYQPVERKLRITRRCLEVLAEFRNPVVLITKSALVTRDVDVLGELARHRAVGVILSVTTLDPELAGALEPRAAAPARRIEAIRTLAQAGIPVGVFAAPIIPALTDHEIPAILEAAAEAGASFAGYTIVRLPGAVEAIFEEWLDRFEPSRKEKVLNRLREMRGGALNDPRFGVRMRGEGAFAAQIRGLFNIAKKKTGLDKPMPDLSVDAFRCPPRGGQLSLFE